MAGDMARTGLLLLGWGLACAPQPTAEPSPSYPTIEEDPRVRVLLVHSYAPDYEWTEGITRGATEVAAQHPDLRLEVFYMDTKRRTEEAWKVEAGRVAAEITEEWQPRVVIAADDNAQQYYARHLAGREDLDVVFCGVNAEPEIYGYPASNITGLLERPHFERSLHILDELRPGLKRIAMLSDESPTSDAGLAFLRSQPSSHRVGKWRQARRYGDWKRAVRELTATHDALGVFMYHTIVEGGRPVPAREVMAWTVKHSRKPVFGLFSFAIDDGALTGYVHSAVENGREAMRLAEAIVHGGAPSEFEVTAAVTGRSMLNLDAARRLGLELGPDVVNRFDLVVRERFEAP